MKRTLLIVDDIKSNREILKNMLGNEYKLLEAAHGQEALAVMSREYQNISAVLLDLGMPVMDGFEVLNYMQGSEKLSKLPVIVTTGQTDTGSEERALRLGAKDYISKPYKSAIIRQRIWNTINLRETAATVNALQRDRLTGLYSRDTFFEKVSEMVAAHGPNYYTMACFDVDKFKVINDQYGTEKGDEVLRHVAGAFETGFSQIGGICCRIASDNFAVLYPTEFRDTDWSVKLQKQICNVPGLASPIVISIGRYTVCDTAMSPSAMYDRAMLAADSVKGRYDTKTAEYDESMRDRLLQEQEIVTEMETARVERQFVIWYQPQYNHASGALIGAEALVRWQHPEKGLLQPGTFIPVFEQNGFIYALDKYVWEGVCRYLRAEIDAGRSPLPVSVNVSRYDVFCEDFLEMLTGIVGRYGVPVELLRLEITESAFAEATERIVAMVRQLIDLGFTIEIDDFGSGYSSLNTLKNVPAQIVKLDMRFLEDDGDSDRGGNIIESVVRMTKWLGMSVIAEGVERLAQADYLKSIGCNYVQGYLYSKPMPEDAYRALCNSSTGKEEKLIALETVENLDNNAFWNPESMDTLIFNSYVGAACIYEYHDGEIELLRATDAFAEMIGDKALTVEEALRLDLSAHLASQYRERLIAALDRSVATKESVTGEYIFLDLPGCPHETYLRSTMRVIATAGDRCLVYCTNENMTAQRTSERRERETSERLQTVLDSVSCGITAVSFEGKHVSYILANHRYYELLGYTEEQYSSEISGDAFSTVYSEDLPRIMHITDGVNKTGTPAVLEYRAVRRDGRIVWMRSLISVADLDGVDGRVQISTYTDITEQKLAQQALQDTTAQLSSMMNDMPGGFVRMHVDKDGIARPVYCNAGYLKLVNMDYDERRILCENDTFAGVHPDDVAIARQSFAKMLHSKAARTDRYRLKNGDGNYIWASVTGRATKDVSGEVFLNLYYSDATEQVRSEERQRELLDNLPYGTALYEYDGETLSVVHLNKRYWELVDRSEEQYFGIGFLKAVHAADRDIITLEIAAAIREQRDIACDVRILYGEDEYRPFHIVGRVMSKKSGGYSIYAVYTPITDEAMSIQEMLPIALSAVMNSQTEYAFVKDRNLRYVCASDEVARLVHAASGADMAGKSDYDFFDKPLADAFTKDDRYVLETGESLIDNIDRIPSEDGSLHYACTSKFPLKDAEGNILGVYGIGRDVTETRRMQTQLELLTNSIPGGIAIYAGRIEAIDRARLVYFSDGFCRLFGYEREEYTKLAAVNAMGMALPEDLPKIREQIRALVLHGTPMDYTYRATVKDGSRKWINVGAVMGEPDGDDVTVNAVFIDVTEHQATLEHLRISEEENRLAMRQTGNTLCRYDVKTSTLRLPNGPQALFNLPEELDDVPEGPIARGNISPETADAYRALYEGIRNGEPTGEAIYRRRSRSGWRWLEAHSTTIFSDAGAPVSAVLSFSDITDRVEKDFAYRRWQQSFDTRAPGSYTLFRCNLTNGTNYDSWQGDLLQIRFSPDASDFNEHTAEYVERYVHPDDSARFSAFLNMEALLSGFYRDKRIVKLEYRERLPEGGDRWLRLTVDLVEHEHSEGVEAYMLFEDIDESKRRELLTLAQAETDSLTGVLNRTAFVAQVNERLKMTKPNAQHALLMLDIDGFKQVNDAFGHRAGDQALTDIADALRAVTGEHDLIGRLGGDEFLLFLQDIPGDVVAAARAKQICALTRKSFSAEVEISASVGIAIAPHDGEDLDTLYRKADAALYHVKGVGKDSYAFYQDEMAGEHLVLEDLPAQADTAVQVKKRRMLIVDDSRIDHAMLTNIFADTFIVEKARDGNSALIRLRHYGSAISVVLLDLVMPGMDGFAVLKRMQESEELRNIPVIVVSGDENRETSLRAIREGATDFVNKPVDPEVLRIRVQSAISKTENERLRAKNSFLEYQNAEITRYRTALERSGIVVIEHDWIAGTFIYDATITKHIAGNYDKRGFWHVLLSDFVADTQTVQKMQELVHEIASDRTRRSEEMLVQLKTPDRTKHWFRMDAYKVTSVFGLTGKIYITLIDLGRERPAES